ncbi:MAG TPA: protealysin inhibitor emfourin [Anaerolineales bacterium]|nr:protealysin inhibitor emfourin [Anaerolineales bacterium]
MAKITFKRSGGFVGEPLRFELNLNSLPIHAVRDITRLVEEAQFFDLPENLIKNFKPDEYQYTITVDAGITYHTVRTNDSTMPTSLRPLVKELSLLSTTQQEINVGGLM